MPPTPPANLDVPSAWMGAELGADGSWIWELTEQQAYELAAPVLSETVRTMLLEIRHELVSGRGFHLIRGLRVDDMSENEAGRVFVRIGEVLGSLRSQNASGDLLGHVRNTGADATDPNVRIYQTSERQTFHTDSADVVGLLCLETAAQGGESMLVSAATIYNRMMVIDPELTRLLFEPVATDRRGEVPPDADPFFTIPILNWFDDHLTVLYQRQYIESAQRFDDVSSLSGPLIAALNLFDSIANDPEVHLRMTLRPGDMQFVHNHSLLHDRTGFVDKPDSPRHLLRLWLSVPNDRELPTVFTQRYGSIEVGDRGGVLVR